MTRINLNVYITVFDVCLVNICGVVDHSTLFTQTILLFSDLIDMQQNIKFLKSRSSGFKFIVVLCA